MEDSDLIALGCSQKGGRFRSSTGDSNAQPSLRATVLAEETASKELISMHVVPEE